MSQTPPQISPLGYAPPPERRNLKNVATYQRNINLCIMTYIIGFIGLIVVQAPTLKFVIALGLFATTIVGAVFVFMLAIELYNVAAGVVLGLCTVIPLIGLIVLLIVNGRATRVLRQRGVKVGLLGANPSSVSPETFHLS